MPENVKEGQLADTRDGQLYYVGKMKDGRCWMLQNLALGSTSEATVLTSASSDVSSDWSLPKSYTSATSGSTSATAVQSWNFGKWVLATPLLTTSCDDASLSGCTRYGFVDVSSSSFQPTYTATTRSWEGTNANNSTLVSVSCISWSGSGTSKICTAGTYDAHYLVGNYYSWNAATAGTGGSITSGEASGSICPKGWRLPRGGTGGEFVGLLSQYGVDSGIDSGAYNIAGAPLRFVRGGYVSPGGGLVLNGSAGAGGFYWSSTPGSASFSAYNLKVDVSRVFPSGYYNRYYSQSVRCIVE